MAIISEYGILKWNNSNKKRYVELGYRFTKNGDEFQVLISEMTKSTRAIILLKCDYCGIEYNSTFKAYNSNRDRSISKKECCKNRECVAKKMIESNMIKYGEKSSNSSDIVKLNKIKSLKEKYGENIVNVSQIKEVRNKINETNIARYGYSNHLASPAFVKLYSRENHYQWKGGVKNSISWLRNKTSKWRDESLLKGNYKCALTSSRDIDVHHLYSFHKIYEEVMVNTGIEVKQLVSEYSEIEKDLIIKEFNIVHSSYGLGICIDSSLHKIYHQNYGYGDNTSEQFEEFSKRFKSGEFDELLREKEVS